MPRNWDNPRFDELNMLDGKIHRARRVLAEWREHEFVMLLACDEPSAEDALGFDPKNSLAKARSAIVQTARHIQYLLLKRDMGSKTVDEEIRRAREFLAAQSATRH